MKRLTMRVPIWSRTLHSASRQAVSLLVLSLLLVLTGCVAVVPEPSVVEPEAEPQIFVEPVPSQMGALVSATGSGWHPGETVYLSLETEIEGRSLSTPVAVAQTNEIGWFAISFIFPAEGPWAAQTMVALAARAVQSDLAVMTELTVNAPVAAVPLTTVPTAIPTLVASVSRPTTTSRGEVNGDFVNVRQGPSTAYAVFFVAEQGDRFTVLGQNRTGDWLRIRLDAGADGWIARVFTNFTDTVTTVGDVIVPVVTTPTILNWTAEYFNNSTLSGSPVVVRNDGNLKFDWGFSSPTSVVPADNFSARWTRNLFFPAGIYRFSVTADDGVRVWIDGELVIDEWSSSPARTVSIERTFRTSATHLLRIEYYEQTERAVIDFWWERTGDFSQWQGAYFANRNLTGAPVLTRNDVSIDFEWGGASPATGLPRDNFSVRWTRSLSFEQGLYRFRALMDDGLRLYIDGNLVVDQWGDGGAREVVADYRLNRGIHALRVEYYERSGDAIARVWWDRLEPAVQYPDWKGEYWPNISLTGTPTLVRNDPVIRFNWSQDGPVGLGTVDGFSSRWTRSAQFESGIYRFRADADDGIRLWVDEQLVIDDWRDGGAGEVVVDRQMTRGQHLVRVEYYERSGLAAVNVMWERIAEVSDFPEWKGEYWSNRDLAGTPTLVRNDRLVEFNWGAGAVTDGMPSDRFSARWSRNLRFDRGNYRFYVRADDGVRAYLDGNVIMDQWHSNDASQVYQTERTLDGTYQFKIEYYEDRGNARVEFWWQRVVAPPAQVPTPTETAVPTNTPEPTATPLATTEATATYTPEPTPTDTLEPTPTDTPEPTSSLLVVQNSTTGQIDVSASGLPANLQVDVYLVMPDGTRIEESRVSAQTDESGGYTISFLMPATWPNGESIVPGPVTIVVVTQDDAVGNTATFDYAAP